MVSEVLLDTKVGDFSSCKNIRTDQSIYKFNIVLIFYKSNEPQRICIFVNKI